MYFHETFLTCQKALRYSREEKEKKKIEKSSAMAKKLYAIVTENNKLQNTKE